MPTLLETPRPAATRRSPDRRRRTLKIALAIVASLLLHGLILLGVVWLVPHWPRGKTHARSRPIELMVVPPTRQEPSGPADAKGTPPPYIRTLDDQAADRPPDDRSFQSDKDTHAASERPPDGQKPLPSTDGRELSSFDFETRPVRLDTHAADAATSAPAASPEPTPAPANTPQPTATPDTKKLPGKSRAQRKPATQPTPAATADPTSLRSESTPSPEPPVPTPQDTPKDEDNSSVPPPPRQANPQRTTSAAPSNATSNGAPKPPGYQPMSIATKMTGNINNRGRSAVSALGTPLGRYEKLVSDAIGMLWNYKAEDKASELSSGTVKIHFYVDQDGRVKNMRFTGGNANGTLGFISEEAVTEAQIPPIPPDVVATLDARQLEVEYTFSMYSF